MNSRDRNYTIEFTHLLEFSLRGRSWDTCSREGRGGDWRGRGWIRGLGHVRHPHPQALALRVPKPPVSQWMRLAL